MNNPATRLYLAFSGTAAIVAAVLSRIDWTLTAVALCFIIFGGLAFVAGWHTGRQDMASSRRPAPRQQEQPAAIRVGVREIPVNGRLAPRNEQAQP